MTVPSLHFETAFEPCAGTPVQVGPALIRITARNSGPFTFTGTNTYLIGTHRLVVVDPGPSEPGHQAALLDAIGRRRVEAILLTHTHRDHSDLARQLQRQTGALIICGGPHRLSRALRPGETNAVADSCDWDLLPDRVARNAEVLDWGEVSVQVIETPGHCANHMAFAVLGTPFLLTGDHVMAWNSTLISPPDGDMNAYLASLRLMADIAQNIYLPGHGGPIASGPGHAAALLRHREMRNEQIVAAVAGGARDNRDLVETLYPTLAPELRTAAAMTVAAHVEYLVARGELISNATGNDLRLAPTP